MTCSQCVSIAEAGGTADALTIPELPCEATTNLLILKLTATNTVVAPTLQMTGGTALPIVKSDGTALTVGELVSGNYVLLCGTGSQWRLLAGA